MHHCHNTLARLLLGLILSLGTVVCKPPLTKEVYQGDMQRLAAEGLNRSHFRGRDIQDPNNDEDPKPTMYRLYGEGSDRGNWFTGNVDAAGNPVPTEQERMDRRAKKATEALLQFDRACRPSTSFSLLKFSKKMQQYKMSEKDGETPPGPVESIELKTTTTLYAKNESKPIQDK